MNRSRTFAPVLAALAAACVFAFPAAQPAMAGPDIDPVVEVFDTAVASGADVVSNTSTGGARLAPQVPTVYRVMVALDTTASWLNVAVTKSIRGTSVTKTTRLGSEELTAGTIHHLAFQAGPGATFNLRFETTTRVAYFSVQAVTGAVLLSRNSSSSGGGGLSNPLAADLSVGGNLITSADGTAQLELANTFAALRDTTGSSEATATSLGLDLYGHSKVEVGIGGSGVGTFNSGGLTMSSGKAVTGGALSWTSATLTYSLGANTATAFMRREGDTAVFRCNLLFSGAPAAGNLLVTLPVGMTIDTNKLPGGTSTTAKVGCGAWLDAGVNRYPSVSVWLSDSTSVYVLTDTQKGSTGDPMESNGTQAIFTVGASDELYFEFAVPVTGW